MKARMWLSAIFVCGVACAMAQKVGHVVDPQTASGNVYRCIHEIDWQTSLSTAEQLAQKSHKMILWVQMKGQLDGYT